MFRLVKQPCIDFIPAVLAELEAMGDSESSYPLYVRNANQGAEIVSSSRDKYCVIKVWGAVSVNVRFYKNGNKSDTLFAGTTKDTKEVAQCIAGWFSE